MTIRDYIAELETKLAEAQEQLSQDQTKVVNDALLKEIQNLIDQRDALVKALRELVDMYVANKGTKSEFITCITPPVSSQMSVEQRAKSKTWKAWDNAREALAALDRTAPADGGKA